MTQNSLKWILNTTLKKMTLLIFLTPPLRWQMSSFFFNEGFPYPDLWDLFDNYHQMICPPTQEYWTHWTDNPWSHQRHLRLHNNNIDSLGGKLVSVSFCTDKGHFFLRLKCCISMAALAASHSSSDADEFQNVMGRCNKPLQGMAPTECLPSACLPACLLTCLPVCLLAC